MTVREEYAVYKQVLDPVGGSRAASALVAMLPLATLFILLGGLSEEGELFRRVVGWSIALLLIMCVLVYLQSTAVWSWMVV